MTKVLEKYATIVDVPGYVRPPPLPPPQPTHPPTHPPIRDHSTSLEPPALPLRV